MQVGGGDESPMPFSVNELRNPYRHQELHYQTESLEALDSRDSS